MDTVLANPDHLLAVLAMFISGKVVVRGSLGSHGVPSWRRMAIILLGGCFAVFGLVGLLVCRTLLLGETAFLLPTSLGAMVAFFAGLSGAGVMLIPRGEGGMTEYGALRAASFSIAMWCFPAFPRFALIALGSIRLVRSLLPSAVTNSRNLWVAEGVLMILLGSLPSTVMGERGLLMLVEWT